MRITLCQVTVRVLQWRGSTEAAQEQAMALELKQELAELVDALTRADLPFAICGGIAVTLHGAPRFTKDIDLLVRAADLEAILRVAAGCGFTLPAAPMVFDRGFAAERRVQRVSKIRNGDLLTLDLILAEPAFVRVWQTRLILDWEGRRLGVVSREGLAEMKRLAGRPQDLLDLERLGAAEPWDE